MRLSIRAMQYFLCAAERGSIARAAEELRVAPSAISNAIDLVEREFDLKLVQRYPAKGIQPTAAGFALIRKVRHLIDEYQNLILEGGELRTALSGNLSIGYYAPVAPAFMPAIAEPLIREHPEVSLSLTECDNEAAQEGLLNGAFEAIVFVAKNSRSGIVQEALIEAPPYLLAPSGHPLARRKSVVFDDLAGQALVMLDLPLTREYYAGLLTENAVEMRAVARASTTEMVRSLVGAGMGCSILNMRPATDVSYHGDEVVAVPIRSAAEPLRLVLGHLGGKPRRLAQAFMDACRVYFAAPAARDLIVESRRG
jgi:DNA-binding transcriptional LysR family regulator